MAGDSKLDRMRRVGVCLMLALWHCAAYTQQEPEYSTYFDHIVAFNPAYAGFRDMVDVTAVYRQQWAGIEGAPTTMAIRAHLPVNLRMAPGGVGIAVTNDEYAFNHNLNVTATYAYHIFTRHGKLGMGLSAGFWQRELEASWQFPGTTQGGTGDPSVPSSSSSDGAFDASFGVYYESSSLYIGISSLHLFEPDFLYEQAGEPLKRQYYVLGGFKKVLQNPAWEFLPSVLFRTDGKMSNFTANCRFEYNKKFYCGVSYRQQDAVTGMLGIELSTGLRIGYAYDFPVSKLGGMSDGSHEFSVRYQFRLGKERRVYKYKSIRIL